MPAVITAPSLGFAGKLGGTNVGDRGPVRSSIASDDTVDDKPVMTGYVRVGDKIYYYLSNGQSGYVGDGECTKLTEWYVVVGDETFAMTRTLARANTTASLAGFIAGGFP